MMPNSDLKLLGEKVRTERKLAGLTHADGQAALRVSVHQQDLLALHRQTDAQIFTGRGLAGAAFLVDDGNRSCFL